MEHTISFSEYVEARHYVSTHEKDLDLFGVAYDTENNRIYEQSASLIQEINESGEAAIAADMAAAEQAAKDLEFAKGAAKKSALNPEKKKGQSWVPKGGKLESYYRDVQRAVLGKDFYGLKELYSEALEKGNKYARMKYLRIYDMLVERDSRQQ